MSALSIGIRKRHGFTLVELLVVIAIIGVLATLLMPTIQGVRESSRRVQCANHLKQLALGFELHHTAHGFFPSGGGDDDPNTPDYYFHVTFDNGNPVLAPDQRAGWGYQILPFIEQERTYLGGDGETDMDKSIVVIGTPHSVMFCPSRREPEVLTTKDWRRYPANSGRVVRHAKNDYAAASLATSRRYRRGVGVVTRMYPTTKAHIRDGLSNTMALGEKQMNVGRLGQMQNNDNEGYAVGWNYDAIRDTTLAPRPDFVHEVWCGDARFGSSHTGGLNIALAGGSVRFLSYQVDLEMFKRLGHRDDGQAVTLP